MTVRIASSADGMPRKLVLVFSDDCSKESVISSLSSIAAHEAVEYVEVCVDGDDDDK